MTMCLGRVRQGFSNARNMSVFALPINSLPGIHVAKWSAIAQKPFCTLFPKDSPAISSRHSATIAARSTTCAGHGFSGFWEGPPTAFMRRTCAKLFERALPIRPDPQQAYSSAHANVLMFWARESRKIRDVRRSLCSPPFLDSGRPGQPGRAWLGDVHQCLPQDTRLHLLEGSVY